ncbi:DUF6931 family protein [Rubripirellula reticaptiva]|uniref:FHA domain-containing protein n=1 Tax=Rubripirellula reticaptiva TaxID=2528013 RepID=A0A5C6F725_9BACT|nr:hypothetical protein [Rubripirellula reticaptiva]TWU56284.1 hypothetical protein Poly59_25880 [Rubripirellula reticaptiva]
MPLLLTAHPTNQADLRLLLRVGQEARVGSSEWVELSIPDDQSIALEHFVVRCGSDAVVEVLGEQQTLWVNGDGVERFTLSDRCDQKTEFLAGQTSFSIRWSPDLVPKVKEPAAKDEPSDAPVVDDNFRIGEVATRMKLSHTAIDLLQTPDRCSLYLQRLIDAGLADDAIRFIAAALPAVVAVDWAIVSSGLIESAKDPLLDAMLAWTSTGGEADRRVVAEQLKKVVEPSNVVKWISQAIVLSGGSLARDDQPMIVPPKHLCGIAILTAHRWSLAAQADRTVAMSQWLESGKLLLDQMEATGTRNEHKGAA